MDMAHVHRDIRELESDVKELKDQMVALLNCLSLEYKDVKEMVKRKER